MGCVFNPNNIISVSKPTLPFQIQAHLTRPSKNPPKNLRYPRRSKPPPPEEFDITTTTKTFKPSQILPNSDTQTELALSDNNSEWSEEEIEAIASLFSRRTPPQRPTHHPRREKPLPLPHRIRPLKVPSPKPNHAKLAHRPSSLAHRVFKDPIFLIGLAREIRDLPLSSDASEVLDNWVQFLRKGSLALTIRELGTMGLPDRALQTLCWAQKHPHLFPDDRILSSAVEVLARTRRLKMSVEMEKFLNSASDGVVEAVTRGFISGGDLRVARKLLLVAKDNGRSLDASIHVKLILAVASDPDKEKLLAALLDEMSEREELKLRQRDCTAVMKACARLGRFEAVESLFGWLKESGEAITVVTYTMVIHSRWCEGRLREAMALVWDMEKEGVLLDLPAYRVVIRLFVGMNDLARAVRYFAKLKEAGFSPTYDVYQGLIRVYAEAGRVAKCRMVCREAEMAGFTLDKEVLALMLEMEGK
ncbi:Pentatricopeptide repeat-containing protein [Acorus calamus]|uniref:Pentatricopeptide repeat-containing protein n=1 Tax=Acorus calamus TaxID=4465 RepID=A0AAV9DWT6_ACOCL|nr:Pentatricopeptide repeat-containing protein [Acorus calamus]